MVSSFLYVPNLIGYLRVVAGFVSYTYASPHSSVHAPRVAFSLYLIGQALDVVDGFAARYLRQTSELGRVLDMVTDRASTTCLSLILASLYPHYLTLFCALITLDLFSHWYHMHAALIGGASSHKGSANWVVRLYYRRSVLFIVCAGTELWYLSLYAMYFVPDLMFSLPGGIALPLCRTLTMITTPIFAFKQVTNVVQLHVAMHTLVEIDADAQRKAS